jgi:Bacterial sugar transferase
MNKGRKGGQLAARLWDIIFAGAGLIVLWPLFATVALLILMFDGRPVLFRQTRIGMSGKPFHIVKFHTMRNEADGAPITAGGDERITKAGAWLRRYEKLRLNLQYQRSRSLPCNLKLLWMTGRYSFFPRGFSRERILRALG